MKLESIFKDGEEIPKEHGMFNGNIMPLMKISDIPEGTKFLGVTITDPDSMEFAKKIWIHLAMFNIPPHMKVITGIPDGVLVLPNSFEEEGYGGMAPPDKPHTYQLKAYAFKSPIEVDEFKPDEFDMMYAEDIIDSAVLTGVYKPDKQ